jgi:hypothetical protein
MLAREVIITTENWTEGSAERLRQILRLAAARRLRPIIVMGPTGDDILRSTPQIADCEMVFDPNFNLSSFAPIKAGLHATTGASFVVSTARECPTETELEALSATFSALEETAPVDVLRLVSQRIRSTQTFLVTRKGTQRLKALKAETDWLQTGEILYKDIEIP